MITQEKLYERAIWKNGWKLLPHSNKSYIHYENKNSLVSRYDEAMVAN